MAKDELMIRIDQIPGDGLVIDRELDAATVAEVVDGAPVELPRGVRLEGRLERVEQVVYARGTLRCTVAVDCARCLDPVSLQIDTSFEFGIFPEGHEPQPSTDGEIIVSDMEVATYRGGKIDLRSIVRDELLLQLPMNPSCLDSIEGKCAEFDSKIVVTTAGEITPESPWAVLRAVKPKPD